MKEGETVKNSWFNDVFLPSIFSRCGVNNLFLMTRKQVAVCKNYFHNYSYIWNGRKITLTIMQNGAGKLYFAPTTEEKGEAQKQLASMAKEKELASLRRLHDRRNENDRAVRCYQQTLQDLRNSLDNFRASLQDAEQENNITDIAFFTTKIKETEEKIKGLTED